ncbi:MAG: SAM-dependent methyltransferase [Alistipes sp.]|jgi:hypothetical protein|nr:SAM-dependent methyltransferase [Alistipes sp.]
MTDLDILLGDEFGRSVEENLGRDPMSIALDRRLPHAAAVASQVKYLRRAERKLPSYYSARCVLPPVAFEQSSSEETAARKNYSGGLAIDLTCGLGVDSFWLSKRFERVIAVERDEFLAAVARENFRRLGALNIQVIRASAEEFLLDGGRAIGRADLVYADPDRRSASGKKMVRMEDCSPDIVTLLPDIQRVASRLVVKLSPLFDVDEVFRIFGRSGGWGGGFLGGGDCQTTVCVEVVSLGGECKEIIADVVMGACAEVGAGAGVGGGAEGSDARAEARIRAVAIGLGEVEYARGDDSQASENRAAVASQRTLAQEFTPDEYRYLIVPDVALQKARVARRYLLERGVWIDSDNGYGFSVGEVGGGGIGGEIGGEIGRADGGADSGGNGGAVLGKVFEIESVEPFDPKVLRRRLKVGGVRSVEVMRHNFPLSAVEIARGLGIREGSAGGKGGGAKNSGAKSVNAESISAKGAKSGSPRIAFTKAAGKLWQVTLKEILR